MAEHKHAVVLRAIADGKAVQLRTALQGVWIDFDVDSHINPITSGINAEWRIKPEPKPDVVRYCPVNTSGGLRTLDEARHYFPGAKAVVKLTFDGETGQCRAEVLP